MTLDSVSGTRSLHDVSMFSQTLEPRVRDAIAVDQDADVYGAGGRGSGFAIASGRPSGALDPGEAAAEARRGQRAPPLATPPSQLDLAHRIGRLLATSLAMIAIAATTFVLALVAIQRDFRDADGFIDCWPNCSLLQDVVGVTVFAAVYRSGRVETWRRAC